MKIENLSVEEIKPYPKNPRKNEDAVSEVMRSLAEYGFQQPLVLDENKEIIVGHTRFKAAKALGLTSVPCIIAKELNEAKAKSYRIMDNKSGEIAEWDIDYLGEEVHDLIDLEYDTDMTGFSETELLDLGIFEDEEDLGNTDEDDAPDMPEEPTARLGDLWTMGDHRLLCGDSTSMTDLDRLMDGVKADMVFTDPPYNANYKSRGSNNLLRQGIQNDAMSNDAFEIFIQGFLATLYASTKAGASYYICCNWKDSYPRFYRNMTESGVNVSSCIVWNKGSGGMGWQDYRYQYEFIIYAFKQDQGHIWYGGRAETDIWTMNREARGTYIHPTQKPVELIRRALKNSSKSEDVVLDLFGGSGSTLIGCQKMKRSARLMELDPRYCDVIIQRWEQFTGQTAVLER